MRKVALALVALMVAGCAQIPITGEVEFGPELEIQQTEDFAFYSPSGPEFGATQQEIVSGFLNAHIGPQNDYAIAREFLTADFRSAWSPGKEVLLRSSAPSFESVGNKTQRVNLRVYATVNEFGEYQSNSELQSRVMSLTLTQENGEWRISDSPNLTVVTAPVFAVIFRPFPVYFYDAGFRYLVPDLRWFPVRSSSATRVVNALLAGPSDWLSSSVKTAIPEGTRLTIDSVPVVDGVAEVDFDSQALEAGNEQRLLMRAQLDATLSKLSNVSNISILVNRNPQDIAVFAPEQLPAQPGSPIMLGKDGVYRINGSSAIPVAGSAAPVISSQATTAALSPSGNLLALSSAAGLFLSNLGSNQTELVDDRLELLNPQFDVEGYLWSVSKNTGILVRSELGSSFSISEAATGGTKVDFAVSPEGARFAQVVSRGDQTELLISGIIRDSLGQPRSITEPVVMRSNSPIAVSWVGEQQLAVIEQTGLGGSNLAKIWVMGERVNQDNPPVVVSDITAVGSNLFVLSESGAVWSTIGSSWRQLVADGISLSSTR